MKRQPFLLLLMSLLLLAPLTVVLAQGTVFEEPNFFDVQITNQLSQPTSMEFAPDGRLFVLQKGGTIRIVQNNVLLSTPFMTISVQNLGERGLLGIAFDPDFEDNDYFYLYYTTLTSPYHNRISRFTANGNTANPGTEVHIFDLDNLGGSNNHNGGQLGFGADGKLYAAVGDGGDSPSNAQSLNNVFGKILRINSNGSIPTNNPFYDTATGNNRAIWVNGLRNPFVFDIQPGTGRMHINDVGNISWEEINLGQAGKNYGWPITEGDAAFGTPPANYLGPIYTYSIANNVPCAITGGAFYNPTTNQFPAAFTGDYFFVDYCSGEIDVYDIASDTASPFASNLPLFPVDLEVGPDGSLYYLTYTSNVLSRIYYQGSAVPPTISVHPQDATVAVGQTAQFSCSATGTAPITYQWQRNSVNIPGATSSSYTTPTTVVGDDGDQFRCVANNVTNNPDTSNQATLTVINATPPTPQITITLPNSASPPLYEAGEVMQFNSSYTDPDPADANLPASSFDWSIDFHHDAHTHPFHDSLPDRYSGEVTINAQGHTETTVWYRVHLTVTDNYGLSASIYTDVFPLLSEIQLRSVPSGLTLELDGQARTTPADVSSVSGVQRVLSAPMLQLYNGENYQFTYWNHGGNATQTITTPPAFTAYWAHYLPEAQVSPTDAAPERTYFVVANPRLTWSQITWAVGYHIQVSQLEDFSTLDFEQDNLSKTTFFVVTSALSEGDYYWRVRAKRADGTFGDWNLDTFTIDLP